jgi:hypothetical protein
MSDKLQMFTMAIEHPFYFSICCFGVFWVMIGFAVLMAAPLAVVMNSTRPATTEKKQEKKEE